MFECRGAWDFGRLGGMDPTSDIPDEFGEIPNGTEDEEGACDPDADCFRPPTKNCIVVCLHCREQYDSYKIHWVESVGKDGKKRGFWRCPTSGCGGAGFNFDIYPIDPNYENEADRGFVGGWFDDDGNRVPPPMD